MSKLTLQEILIIEPRLQSIVDYCIQLNAQAKKEEIYWYHHWSDLKRKMQYLIGWDALKEELATSEAWDTFTDYLEELTPNTL